MRATRTKAEEALDEIQRRELGSGRNVVTAVPYTPSTPEPHWSSVDQDLLTNAADPITFVGASHDHGAQLQNLGADQTMSSNVVKQNAIQVQDSTTGASKPQFIDMELHGHMVPLLELKKALRQDKQLNQQAIADLTQPHTVDGKPMHQTSVSGFLIGKVAMHTIVRDVLEQVFTPAEAAKMAKGHSVPASATSTAAAPVAPPPPPPAPTFTNSTATAAGRAPEPRSSTATATVAVRAVRFPLDKAHDVAKDVRQAKKNGEITSTFSLRKIITWGRAFYLLQAEGFNADESLAGAFHLAVEAKTYGEDQRFLKDLFQAKFGFESKPPRQDAARALADGRHPVSYLIEPLIREGLAVWLVGETGAGKTHSIFDISARLGRNVIRFQGKRDATTDDFVGGFGVDEKNGASVSVFQYGALPLAMKNGDILNIDEITALPAEVLFELQAVLEGKPLVLTKNRGEVIHAAPGFCIVAADNTLGLGEAAEYVGTNVMNEAFRDRFYFVHYDYMPEKHEKAAIKSELDAFLNARGWAA